MILWCYHINFHRRCRYIDFFRIDPKFVNNPELSDIQVKNFKSEIEFQITSAKFSIPLIQVPSRGPALLRAQACSHNILLQV